MSENQVRLGLSATAFLPTYKVPVTQLQDPLLFPPGNVLSQTRIPSPDTRIVSHVLMNPPAPHQLPLTQVYHVAQPSIEAANTGTFSPNGKNVTSSAVNVVEPLFIRKAPSQDKNNANIIIIGDPLQKAQHVGPESTHTFTTPNRCSSFSPEKTHKIDDRDQCDLKITEVFSLASVPGNGIEAYKPSGSPNHTYKQLEMLDGGAEDVEYESTVLDLSLPERVRAMGSPLNLSKKPKQRTIFSSNAPVGTIENTMEAVFATNPDKKNPKPTADKSPTRETGNQPGFISLNKEAKHKKYAPEQVDTEINSLVAASVCERDKRKKELVQRETASQVIGQTSLIKTSVQESINQSVQKHTQDKVPISLKTPTIQLLLSKDPINSMKGDNIKMVKARNDDSSISSLSENRKAPNQVPFDKSYSTVTNQHSLLVPIRETRCTAIIKPTENSQQQEDPKLKKPAIYKTLLKPNPLNNANATVQGKGKEPVKSRPTKETVQSIKERVQNIILERKNTVSSQNNVIPPSTTSVSVKKVSNSVSLQNSFAKPGPSSLNDSTDLSDCESLPDTIPYTDEDYQSGVFGKNYPQRGKKSVCSLLNAVTDVPKKDDAIGTPGNRDNAMSGLMMLSAVATMLKENDTNKTTKGKKKAKKPVYKSTHGIANDHKYASPKKIILDSHQMEFLKPFGSPRKRKSISWKLKGKPKEPETISAHLNVEVDDHKKMKKVENIKLKISKKLFLPKRKLVVHKENESVAFVDSTKNESLQSKIPQKSEHNDSQKSKPEKQTVTDCVSEKAVTEKKELFDPSPIGFIKLTLDKKEETVNVPDKIKVSDSKEKDADSSNNKSDGISLHVTEKIEDKCLKNGETDEVKVDASEEDEFIVVDDIDTAQERETIDENRIINSLSTDVKACDSKEKSQNVKNGLKKNTSHALKHVQKDDFNTDGKISKRGKKLGNKTNKVKCRKIKSKGKMKQRVDKDLCIRLKRLTKRNIRHIVDSFKAKDNETSRRNLFDSFQVDDCDNNSISGALSDVSVSSGESKMNIFSPKKLGSMMQQFNISAVRKKYKYMFGVDTPIRKRSCSIYGSTPCEAAKLRRQNNSLTFYENEEAKFKKQHNVREGKHVAAIMQGYRKKRGRRGNIQRKYLQKRHYKQKGVKRTKYKKGKGKTSFTSIWMKNMLKKYKHHYSYGSVGDRVKLRSRNAQVTGYVTRVYQKRTQSNASGKKEEQILKKTKESRTKYVQPIFELNGDRILENSGFLGKSNKRKQKLDETSAEPPKTKIKKSLPKHPTDKIPLNAKTMPKLLISIKDEVGNSRVKQEELSKPDRLLSLKTPGKLAKTEAEIPNSLSEIGHFSNPEVENYTLEAPTHVSPKMLQDFRLASKLEASQPKVAVVAEKQEQDLVSGFSLDESKLEDEKGAKHIILEDGDQINLSSSDCSNDEIITDNTDPLPEMPGSQDSDGRVEQLCAAQQESLPDTLNTENVTGETKKSEVRLTRSMKLDALGPAKRTRSISQTSVNSPQRSPIRIKIKKSSIIGKHAYKKQSLHSPLRRKLKLSTVQKVLTFKKKKDSPLKYAWEANSTNNGNEKNSIVKTKIDFAKNRKHFMKKKQSRKEPKTQDKFSAKSNYCVESGMDGANGFKEPKNPLPNVKKNLEKKRNISTDCLPKITLPKQTLPQFILPKSDGKIKKRQQKHVARKSLANRGPMVQKYNPAKINRKLGRVVRKSIEELVVTPYNKEQSNILPEEDVQQDTDKPCGVRTVRGIHVHNSLLEKIKKGCPQKLKILSIRLQKGFCEGKDCS